MTRVAALVAPTHDTLSHDLKLYTKAQLPPFAAVALAALVGVAALAISFSAKRF